MAHIGKLPDVQRIVTTHNEHGQAIIDQSVDSKAPFDGSVENGKAAFSLAYLTTQFPVDLNESKDVETYRQYLASPPGLVQNNGSVLRFVVCNPIPKVRTQRVSFSLKKKVKS